MGPMVINLQKLEILLMDQMVLAAPKLVALLIAQADRLNKP